MPDLKPLSQNVENIYALPFPGKVAQNAHACLYKISAMGVGLALAVTAATSNSFIFNYVANSHSFDYISFSLN